MKTIRLPQTQSPTIHLECFRGDGSGYCIETKRCATIAVEDDVVDVLVTELSASRRQLRLSRGWDDGRRMALKQAVSFVIA
jgi:hypothetical protein